MSTTWPSGCTAGDFFSSNYASYALGQGLFDRDQCLKNRWTTVYHAQQVYPSGSSYSKAFEIKLMMPSWVTSGMTIYLIVSGYTNNGTAYCLLNEGTYPITGPATSWSTEGMQTMTLGVPTNAWANTEKTINVLTAHTGTSGSVTMYMDNLACNFGFRD